jgi:hypothetical protein
VKAWILTFARGMFAGDAEGLSEVKPPCPANGMQIHSGEMEILRKAVEDHFCFCYGNTHTKCKSPKQSLRSKTGAQTVAHCDYLEGCKYCQTHSSSNNQVLCTRLSVPTEHSSVT